MPQIVFQVTAQHDFLRKMTDPRFWELYRMFVVREITEGALDVIRKYAARQWGMTEGKPDPNKRGASGGGLNQSWKSVYDVGRGIGSIRNTQPYAYWLNYGVRAHKMKYIVLNARDAWYLSDGTKAVTVPLIIEGEETFRVATAKQMEQNPGGPPWWHPGITPYHFLEKGMEEYRQTKLQADFQGLTVRILGLMG